MTLIEVLLAVSILGFSLAVMLTATARCLGVLKAARGYQTAIWTLGAGDAKNPLQSTAKLEDLKVAPETYENGCSFERTIEDDEDEDNLYVVRTKVTWEERGREMSEEVVRYLHYVEGEQSGTAAPSVTSQPATTQPGTPPATQPDTRTRTAPVQPRFQTPSDSRGRGMLRTPGPAPLPSGGAGRMSLPLPPTGGGGE